MVERAKASEGRRSADVRHAIRSELAVDARAGKSGRERDPSVPVVQLDDVTLSFDLPIIQDVSFVACQGETIVIVGESGTGKSTTLKFILRASACPNGAAC